MLRLGNKAIEFGAEIVRMFDRYPRIITFTYKGKE